MLTTTCIDCILARDLSGQERGEFTIDRNIANMGSFQVSVEKNPEPDPVKVIKLQVECQNCYLPTRTYSISIVDAEGKCIEKTCGQFFVMVQTEFLEQHLVMVPPFFWTKVAAQIFH